MKYIAFDNFGDASVLYVAEREVPQPKNEEILVRIKAAAVNPIDWKVRAGEMKFIPGQKFPHMLGSDFSGVIESVGEGVSVWAVGDEVLGWTNSFNGGAYADYVTVPPSSIVAKPSNLSFAQASAIPTGGTAALQGLRDVGRIQKGMRVLVFGCTGGVGVFAVPLAKTLGAYVVGYAGSSSMELAQSLGADEILDHKVNDVLATTEPFDIILELSGHLPFESARTILAPHGVYVDPVPNPSAILGSLFHNLFHGQHHGILMSKLNAVDIKTIADYCAIGKIGITVGKEFPLEQAHEAHLAGESGKVVGKIVLTTE